MPKNFKPVAASVDKWKRRVTAAGPDYSTGVQNAQNWAANAVAAAPRRNAGLQRAIANGAIDRGIQAVGDAGWRAGAMSKGVGAYTANAPAAAAKYQAGLTKAMNYQQAAQAATDGMDTSTLEGRIAKASAWQRAVSNAAQAAKGGS